MISYRSNLLTHILSSNLSNIITLLNRTFLCFCLSILLCLIQVKAAQSNLHWHRQAKHPAMYSVGTRQVPAGAQLSVRRYFPPPLLHVMHKPLHRATQICVSKFTNANLSSSCKADQAGAGAQLQVALSETLHIYPNEGDYFLLSLGCMAASSNRGLDMRKMSCPA